ncbi:unnamed protein product [Vitrella brassicaformis CCMP3155]|uniref:Mechanosensitive ion channel MscS domain-containing protein n=6 Tax=Vitrella brassicaformis TaxID=1169539 RepID=A0A0G4EXY1_VITBC|nr:unnamed protein product [Vitrella brassicaformis CCMP3155]|eukprot:CEM04174.1 unnamed protein product [Vitrella brassicaformis CCMP3155]
MEDRPLLDEEMSTEGHIGGRTMSFDQSEDGHRTKKAWLASSVQQDLSAAHTKMPEQPFPKEGDEGNIAAEPDVRSPGRAHMTRVPPLPLRAITQAAKDSKEPVRLPTFPAPEKGEKATKMMDLGDFMRREREQRGRDKGGHPEDTSSAPGRTLEDTSQAGSSYAETAITVADPYSLWERTLQLQQERRAWQLLKPGDAKTDVSKGSAGVASDVGYDASEEGDDDEMSEAVQEDVEEQRESRLRGYWRWLRSLIVIDSKWSLMGHLFLLLACGCVGLYAWYRWPGESGDEEQLGLRLNELWKWGTFGAAVILVRVAIRLVYGFLEILVNLVDQQSELPIGMVLHNIKRESLSWMLVSYFLFIEVMFPKEHRYSKTTGEVRKYVRLALEVGIFIGGEELLRQLLRTYISVARSKQRNAQLQTIVWRLKAIGRLNCPPFRFLRSHRMGLPGMGGTVASIFSPKAKQQPHPPKPPRTTKRASVAAATKKNPFARTARGQTRTTNKTTRAGGTKSPQPTTATPGGGGVAAPPSPILRQDGGPDRPTKVLSVVRFPTDIILQAQDTVLTQDSKGTVTGERERERATNNGTNSSGGEVVSGSTHTHTTAQPATSVATGTATHTHSQSPSPSPGAVSIHIHPPRVATEPNLTPSSQRSRERDLVDNHTGFGFSQTLDLAAASMEEGHAEDIRDTQSHQADRTRGDSLESRPPEECVGTLAPEAFAALWTAGQQQSDVHMPSGEQGEIQRTASPSFSAQPPPAISLQVPNVDTPTLVAYSALEEGALDHEDTSFHRGVSVFHRLASRFMPSLRSSGLPVTKEADGTPKEGGVKEGAPPVKEAAAEEREHRRTSALSRRSRRPREPSAIGGGIAVVGRAGTMASTVADQGGSRRTKTKADRSRSMHFPPPPPDQKAAPIYEGGWGLDGVAAPVAAPPAVGFGAVNVIEYDDSPMHRQVPAELERKRRRVTPSVSTFTGGLLANVDQGRQPSAWESWRYRHYIATHPLRVWNEGRRVEILTRREAQCVASQVFTQLLQWQAAFIPPEAQIVPPAQGGQGQPTPQATPQPPQQQTPPQPPPNEGPERMPTVSDKGGGGDTDGDTDRPGCSPSFAPALALPLVAPLPESAQPKIRRAGTKDTERTSAANRSPKHHPVGGDKSGPRRASTKKTEAAGKADEAAQQGAQGEDGGATVVAAAPTTRLTFGKALLELFLTTEHADSLLRTLDSDGEGIVSRRKFVAAVVDTFTDRQKLLASLQVDDSVTDVLKNTVSGAMWLIAFFIALAMIGVDVFSVLLGTLTITAGLAFALGNMIRNFFDSLVFIFWYQPYDLEDWVVVNNGTPMQVKKVNITCTQFVTWHNKACLFPNSVLALAEIINLSRSPKACFELCFLIGASTPRDKFAELKKSIQMFCLQHPTEWEPNPMFSIYQVQPHAHIQFGIWPTHKMGWAEFKYIYASRNDLFWEILREMDRLNVRYALPPQPILFPPNESPYDGVPGGPGGPDPMTAAMMGGTARGGAAALPHPPLSAESAPSTPRQSEGAPDMQPSPMHGGVPLPPAQMMMMHHHTAAAAMMPQAPVTYAGHDFAPHHVHQHPQHQQSPFGLTHPWQRHTAGGMHHQSHPPMYHPLHPTHAPSPPYPPPNVQNAWYQQMWGGMQPWGRGARGRRKSKQEDPPDRDSKRDRDRDRGRASRAARERVREETGSGTDEVPREVPGLFFGEDAANMV